MMSAGLATFFGTIGITLVLIAFLSTFFKKLSHSTYTYNLMNSIGGFSLAIYAISLNNVIFTILQLVWGSASLFVLIRKILKR